MNHVKKWAKRGLKSPPKLSIHSVLLGVFLTKIQSNVQDSVMDRLQKDFGGLPLQFIPEEGKSFLSQIYRAYRGPIIDRTGKTSVLPKFGGYRIKIFFFKWLYIMYFWSCLSKIHGGAHYSNYLLITIAQFISKFGIRVVIAGFNK